MRLPYSIKLDYNLVGILTIPTEYIFSYKENGVGSKMENSIIRKWNMILGSTSM